MKNKINVLEPLNEAQVQKFIDGPVISTMSDGISEAQMSHGQTLTPLIISSFERFLKHVIGQNAIITVSFNEEENTVVGKISRNYTNDKIKNIQDLINVQDTTFLSCTCSLKEKECLMYLVSVTVTRNFLLLITNFGDTIEILENVKKYINPKGGFTVKYSEAIDHGESLYNVIFPLTNRATHKNRNNNESNFQEENEMSEFKIAENTKVSDTSAESRLIQAHIDFEEEFKKVKKLYKKSPISKKDIVKNMCKFFFGQCFPNQRRENIGEKVPKYFWLFDSSKEEKMIINFYQFETFATKKDFEMLDILKKSTADFFPSELCYIPTWSRTKNEEGEKLKYSCKRFTFDKVKILSLMEMVEEKKLVSRIETVVESSSKVSWGFSDLENALEWHKTALSKYPEQVALLKAGYKNACTKLQKLIIDSGTEEALKKIIRRYIQEVFKDCMGGVGNVGKYFQTKAPELIPDGYMIRLIMFQQYASEKDRKMFEVFQILKNDFFPQEFMYEEDSEGVSNKKRVDKVSLTEEKFLFFPGRFKGCTKDVEDAVVPIKNVIEVGKTFPLFDENEIQNVPAVPKRDSLEDIFNLIKKHVDVKDGEISILSKRIEDLSLQLQKKENSLVSLQEEKIQTLILEFQRRSNNSENGISVLENVAGTMITILKK